jgi:hypothetical protein
VALARKTDVPVKPVGVPLHLRRDANKWRRAMTKIDQGHPRTDLFALKTKIFTRGWQAVDKRSQQAKAMLKWEAALIQALGSTPTAAQGARVKVAVRTRLFLDHLDFELAQATTFFRTKRKGMKYGFRQTLELRTKIAGDLDRTLRDLDAKAKLSVDDLPSFAELAAQAKRDADA